MTTLTTLADTADRTLDAADRARLAELVETYIATYQGPPDFSPDELRDLKRLDAEPFELADPDAVAALFARRG